MDTATPNLLDDLIEQQPPKPASIGKRMAAAIIDGLILIVIFIVMGNLFGDRYTETSTTTYSGNTTTTHSEVVTTSGFHLSGWPGFVVWVAFFFLIPFLEGRSGQTLGKRAMRIRVLRTDGRPTNVGWSFLRHIFDG